MLCKQMLYEIIMAIEQLTIQKIEQSCVPLHSRVSTGTGTLR